MEVFADGKENVTQVRTFAISQFYDDNDIFVRNKTKCGLRMRNQWLP